MTGLRIAALCLASLTMTVVTPNRSLACTTCSVGVSTLTPAGQGLPSAGRLRVALEARAQTLRHEDTAANDIQVHDLRLTTALAWAPNRRLWLSLQLPWVLRMATWQNLEAVDTVGPGDLELGARYIVFKDHAYEPRHLFGLRGTVELPTPIDHHGNNGALLPLAVQSGSGSFSTGVGVFYSHMSDPFTVFAAAEIRIPIVGRYDIALGPRLRASLTGQARLNEQLSLRATVDTQQQSISERGSNAPLLTSWASVSATPGLLWAPSERWLFMLSAELPVWQGRGLRQSVAGLLSVVVDG